MTISQALLEELALEQRRVFSRWRALILIRRATFRLSEDRRRWSQLPGDISDVAPVIRQMQHHGDIAPIRGTPDVYTVDVPFARHLPIDARVVLLEMNPYAVFSHFTALAIHSLTDEQSNRLTVSYSRQSGHDLLPIGTTIDDWEDVERPAGKRPPKVMGHEIQWTGVDIDRFWGFADYRPQGVPIRVTTIERTLLDALQSSDLCGGIGNVLRAWRTAQPLIDVSEMVRLVERFGTGVLRQRIGYLLEELGLSHAALNAWQQGAKRGGSSRLFAASPYAPQYSERWSLSLNAPVEILTDSE